LKNINTKVFRKKFKESLSKSLGVLDEHTFLEVEKYFQWVEVLASDWLFRQDDPGDSLYILINGRLQVSVEESGKAPNVIGQIARGETVGEMAIFTDDRRSASVKALRDSVLVGLSKDDFDQMTGRFPAMVINITRLIIERLKRQNLRQRSAPHYVSIALLPISGSIDLQKIVDQLFLAIKTKKKNVLLLTRDRINQILGNTAISETRQGAGDRNLRLTAWLDEQEALHDFVLYVADEEDDDWTWNCLRHADEVLLLANANGSPKLSRAEKTFLVGEHKQIIANQTLVLIHTQHIDASNLPHNTDAWLGNRTLHDHYHFRPHRPGDFDRLARIICGESHGLVLSGGGAKGIAHLGVFRALESSGIPIDKVGGTSIGAVFGGLIARGLNSGEIRALTRKMFLTNPTPLQDYNLLPFVSLLRGKRLDKMLNEVFKDINIEDLWLPYFCVASDLINRESVIFKSGLQCNAIRSSLSLPAIFPPVVYNNTLLVDGGVSNNFPIDFMADAGADKIIGVYLNQEENSDLNYTRIPSNRELLIDKYFRKERKFKVPSMMTAIIQSSTLQSNNKSKKLFKDVNLLFKPDLSMFSLLSWHRFDQIEEAGYRHAMELLESWEGFT
jgi:NTE family protein